VFIGSDDEDGRRGAWLAAAVGIGRVGGYLHGGMTSWRQEKRPVSHTDRLAVDEIPGRLRADPDLQVLDVRDPGEWDAGHVPGSVLETWHDIAAVPDGLDPARPIAVMCGSGQRAGVAASLIQRYGAGQVIHVVDGGVPRLRALGVALETADDAA